MSITVTPIPLLIEFATPSITIGGTAAAGSALTAIRSDSTIVGITLVGTTVDDSIARYDGTAGQLQGYTSNSPTISDAGVISLTSGQLAFPATQSASGGANVLDDYEEGTFTPAIYDDSMDDQGQSYATNGQVGKYTKIGNMVFCTGYVQMTSLGSLTASQGAILGGLPFTTTADTNIKSSAHMGYGASLAITASTSLAGYVNTNGVVVNLQLWDVAAGVSAFKLSELTADGDFNFNIVYQV